LSGVHYSQIKYRELELRTRTLMKLKNTKILWVLFVTILVSACSTNSLLIKYFYGRMDNKMQNSILNYATFSKAQKSEIKQAVDDFFAWHRTSELPKYAQYLEQISKEIKENDFDQASVLDHLNRIRKLSQDSFKRSPVAIAAPFFKTLSDGQVLEIEARLKKRDEKFTEWYEERELTGGDAGRLKKIVKNVGRVGIKLNADQATIIQRGLDQYRGGPLERFEIWNRWEAELIALFQRRSDAEFEEEVTKHLQQYQNQMRLHSPDNHLHNQQVTASVIHELLVSLTPPQKATLLKKIYQIRKTLISIANR